MQYPDTREALLQLTDGREFAGETVTSYLRLTTTFDQYLPAVLIYNIGGPEGFLDRVDRVGVEVYATGTDSRDIAEAIRSELANRHHDVPGVGLLDRIIVETTPHDVPYPHSSITNSAAVYRITTRPLP